jgi:TPR repeat protein
MKQDPDKAIEWYQKAAAQGFELARQNLERIFENTVTSAFSLDNLDLEHLFTDEDTVRLSKKRSADLDTGVRDPFADLDLGDN